LFQLKIQVFFTELLSVLLTPWILFFSLPPCSATIIDFFREFTVHVDGIGYVCSFAVFDFQRHGTVKVDDAVTSGAADTGGPVADNAKAKGKDKGDGPDMTKVTAVNTGARTRQKQRDYKMEKSFLHFKATHPDWQPDLNGSLFLDKVSAYQPKSQTKTSTHANSGGRGLGIGYGQEERSASYDRAWAKGSHLLRSRLDPYQERSMAGSRLAPMRENEDEDEVDELSWNRGAGNDEDQEEEEEGFMRDAGMVGLLQQVLKR
jgi:autophagy-related protein 9